METAEAILFFPSFQFELSKIRPLRLNTEVSLSEGTLVASDRYHVAPVFLRHKTHKVKVGYSLTSVAQTTMMSAKVASLLI